jgi:hypothetical protein
MRSLPHTFRAMRANEMKVEAGCDHCSLENPELAPLRRRSALATRSRGALLPRGFVALDALERDS